MTRTRAVTGRDGGDGGTAGGGPLPLDHEPAGDQPGDEQRRPGTATHGQVDDPGHGEPDDDGVGEQDQAEHATAAAGRLRAGGAAYGTSGRASTARRRSGVPAEEARVGRPWSTTVGIDGGATGGHDQAGLAAADRLAARQHPHGVGEALDGAAAHRLVMVLERLGDQVDGPGHRQGDEDQCARVHSPRLGSPAQHGADVYRCVAKQLV